MALNNDLIKKFQKITKYDLQSYLLGFEEMAKNHFGKVLEFYSGNVQRIPSPSLRLMDSLVTESKNIDYIINLNSHRFTTTDWWDLLEVIEEIKVKLHTMKNTPKWARTSLVLSKRSSNPSIETQLVQGQTLERLVGGSFGYSDEHQDWYQIAIDNDIEEEDYNPEGGQRVSIVASGGTSFEITTLVDVIDKETIKGKDIYKKITWEGDDFKLVSSDECFIQSCTILAELIKNDNPEFISQGLSRDIAKGQNINSISYPILVRQLTETFATDDTISSFAITKIERVEDGVFIDLNVFSKSSESFEISTII